MITDDSRELWREQRSAKVWVQMVLDQIVVQGLLVFFTYMREGHFSNDYKILATMP